MPGPALLMPPDISPWRAGNRGTPFVHRRDSERPGPEVLIAALMHGNEACGAVALDRMLRENLQPSRGAVTLAFLNVAAYDRIEPAHPERGRFVDEDMNRLWSQERLDGPGRTVELRRARELRAYVEAADYLLDLHSMLEGETPLCLCGTTEKGLRLARRVAYPATVVVDPGHAGGVRLRDYGAFGAAAADKAALLVECGAHFAPSSGAIAFETALRFLRALNMGDARLERDFLPADVPAPQRVIRITDVVTIESERFAFALPLRNLEVIPKAGTLLARDGKREVRTAYDDCVPIMPARQFKPGLTAVRLGRIVAAPNAET